MVNETTARIELSSPGDVRTLNFSVNFDPTRFSNPVVSQIGPGLSMTVNSSEVGDGRIGVQLTSSSTIAPGPQELIRIRWTILPGTAPGQYPVDFIQQPVPFAIADSFGTPLGGNFVNGSIEVLQDPGGLRVLGRVFSPFGIALRNVQVILTDSQGQTRTVNSSSFGFYEFTNVVPNEPYILTARFKRYRFPPQFVQVSTNSVTLDMYGLE